MSEERKPLLSDAKVKNHKADLCNSEQRQLSGWDVRDFYENLITTGKLRVVEEVELNEDGDCSGCGWDSDHIYPFSTCCPGCGNPFKKQ